MLVKIHNAARSILSLPRFAKNIVAIIVDLSLCVLSTWLAFYLRLDQFILIHGVVLTAVIVSVALALPVFWLLGLYRTIFRYSGLSIMFSVSIALLVYGLLYFSVFGIYGVAGIPRSIGILQPMLLFFAVVSSRLFVKYLLGDNYFFKNKSQFLKKTLVYGAGSAGRQLVSALANSNELKVVGFLDDDDRIHGQVLQGQEIYSPLKIADLINLKEAQLVLLALPSISRSKRNEILKNLSSYSLQVQTLPTFADIIQGRVSLSDIKDLDVDDILNRDQVLPNTELLSKNITSKVVLVTGAGGSIGSELSRQIVKQNPEKLLLLELNEFALYKIYEELKIANKNLKIIPLLVNVQDEIKVNEIFKTFKVDTVYHAAAYKHVPLVEENISESIKNNVFATLAVVKASLSQSVENFVLISSDKAVRPTNIMGASKRLAELCVQGLYQNTKNNKTKMSIVRFGNVLESSGSVIPKFKKQIKDGGPITLTHPDVTRYFMTLTEASQLVIQAGAMSEDCAVFVLDMGESIKIKDLIYRIVKLSGLSVNDENNKEGVIEIKIIGLRPGEKLYEELLLGDNPQKTQHPKIQKAQDPFIPFNQLEVYLNNLRTLLDHNKVFEVKELLTKIVKTYQSNSAIVDHVYLEQSKFDKSSYFPMDEGHKVVKIKSN
ncbi:COG1086 Predicted nucleoside-diphosphate sugar epimerases [Candidatus Pelagibacterales bacterium]